MKGKRKMSMNWLFGGGGKDWNAGVMKDLKGQAMGNLSQDFFNTLKSSGGTMPTQNISQEQPFNADMSKMNVFNPDFTSSIPSVNNIMKISQGAPAEQEPQTPVDKMMNGFAQAQKQQVQPAQYPQILESAQQPSFWDKTKNFLGSPLGRSLLTTGLVGGLTTAMGGSPLEAVSYGVQGGGKASDIYRKNKQIEDKNQMKKDYYQNQVFQKELDRFQRENEITQKQNADIELAKLQNQLGIERDKQKPHSLTEQIALYELSKAQAQQNGMVPEALYPQENTASTSYGQPSKGDRIF